MLGSGVLLILSIIDFFLCLSESCQVVSDVINILFVAFYVSLLVSCLPPHFDTS